MPKEVKKKTTKKSAKSTGTTKATKSTSAAKSTGTSKSTAPKNTKNTKSASAKTTKKAVVKAEAPKAEASKTEASKAESCKNGCSYALPIALSSIALVLGIGGFSLSLYSFLGGKSVGVISDGNSANFTEGSIADIANRVSPSVVSIVTETRTSSYFGQSSTSSASGTGMIISSDGYILTNKHVIENANKVSVVLDDGTTYSNVAIVGSDPLNDAAILKISDAKDLTPVKLGDSKTLNVGQQVIAIGNALGQYQNSVTEGIISGVGRNITAGDSSSSYYENLSDMIQTDAQINSGNSGGPLVNAAGEVIGINTALSASGTSGNSISFAIPISSVKGIIKSVIETGELQRAYIGVAYISLNPTIAKTYNLDVNYGAYLASSDSVISGGPAEKAGLKEGDIITKVDNIEIGKNGSLSTLIGEHAVGETVRLTVLRDSSEMTVDVTLTAYKEQTKAPTTVKQ